MSIIRYVQRIFANPIVAYVALTELSSLALVLSLIPTCFHCCVTSALVGPACSRFCGLHIQYLHSSWSNKRLRADKHRLLWEQSHRPFLTTSEDTPLDICTPGRIYVWQQRIDVFTFIPLLKHCCRVAKVHLSRRILFFFLLLESVWRNMLVIFFYLTRLLASHG